MNVRSAKNRISETVRYMVVIIVLLTVVFMAVNSYRTATDMQSANNDSRKELSYIANRIHAADSSGSVSVVSGKYGETLVLKDSTDSGVYETRIYDVGGKLYEEYSEAGAAYDKTGASVISKTGKFSVSESNGVIKVATDEGKIFVSLRTEA